MHDAFFEIPLDETQRTETDEFSFVLKPSRIQGIGVVATHAIAQGTRLALEIGPGRVLAGLARKAAPGLDVKPVFEPAEIATAWNSSGTG